MAEQGWQGGHSSHPGFYSVKEFFAALWKITSFLCLAQRASCAFIKSLSGSVSPLKHLINAIISYSFCCPESPFCVLHKSPWCEQTQSLDPGYTGADRLLYKKSVWSHVKKTLIQHLPNYQGVINGCLSESSAAGRKILLDTPCELFAPHSSLFLR